MNKYLSIIMVLGTMVANLEAMDKKPAANAEKKKSVYQAWKARYLGDKKLKSPEALKTLLDKKNQEIVQSAEFKGVVKQHNFGSSVSQRCS